MSLRNWAIMLRTFNVNWGETLHDALRTSNNPCPHIARRARGTAVETICQLPVMYQHERTAPCTHSHTDSHHARTRRGQRPQWLVLFPGSGTPHSQTHTHILSPSGANMCQRTRACRSKQKPETLTALKSPKNY